MVFHYGERVVIDFNIDSLDKNNPPMFGYISDIIEDENLNPGTLEKRTCYKAIGDDGKEYISIDMVYGKPLIHSFYTKLQTLQILMERTNDIQKELEIMQEYEEIYTDAITRRLLRGQSVEDLMKRYKRFCVNLLDEVRKAADATEYFNDMMMSEFDKSQF